MSDGDLGRAMSAWAARHADGSTGIASPAQWLLDAADLMGPGRRALDVACGGGRHALLLAGVGLVVTALDRDRARVAEVRAQAKRLSIDVQAQVRDLEVADVDLGTACFDLVVGTRYLHRPLMPALVRALAPGGVLVWETFTAAQAARGKPTNPAFLLQPGELPTLVSPLEVLRYREADVDGAAVASIVARKPMGP